ncbi:MAG: hypothetical protein ABFS56_29945 [Pseudomonadota bacterium]
MVKNLGLVHDNLAQLEKDRVQIYAGDTGKRIIYTGMGYLAQLFKLRRIAIETMLDCSLNDLFDRCRQRCQEFLGRGKWKDWRKQLLALHENRRPWQLVILVDAINESREGKSLYDCFQKLIAELAQQKLNNTLSHVKTLMGRSSLG